MKVGEKVSGCFRFPAAVDRCYRLRSDVSTHRNGSPSSPTDACRGHPPRHGLGLTSPPDWLPPLLNRSA